MLGVGETLFDTAAQSVMPSVVERDDLSKANGRLYAVELTMNQFVGPPVGGLLAAIAISLAFAGSALAFAVAALALVALAGSFKPVRDEIENFKPHVVYTLLEEFHYTTAYDQHIASFLELMKVPYTGCNPRGLILARGKDLSKTLVHYRRIAVPAIETISSAWRLTPSRERLRVAAECGE